MNKGQIAGREPIAVEILKGKKYAWCSCGLSKAQPFCDGSHKLAKFKPIIFKAEETKKVYFCVCKQSDNQPYCDGSHSN